MVASWALYFPIVAKSPESQTTVVPAAFNCSSELGMIDQSSEDDERGFKLKS